MPVVRPIGHEDRLSIVDHLDELRRRLIICIGVFLACFAFTYTVNHKILKIVNQPLVDAHKNNKGGGGALGATARFQKQVGVAMKRLDPALIAVGGSLGTLAAQPGVSPTARAQAARAIGQLADASKAVQAAAKAVPKDDGRRPVTLGVAEPFVATFTIAGYAALLLSLPFILWQAYAFLLPAFNSRERRIALPLMAMVPLLFTAGVLFGYFVALPRAVNFLQNFNSDSFDILIQARDYYKFVVLFLALMGLVFQIPVGVLVVTRTGLVTARDLWKRQGYVILGISIVAAVATPTPDPVTMLVTMLPLILLYELSIGLAWIFRPRGATVSSRWGDWWGDGDDEDEDEDLDAGEAPGATEDRTPVS